MVNGSSTQTLTCASARHELHASLQLQDISLRQSEPLTTLRHFSSLPTKGIATRPDAAFIAMADDNHYDFPDDAGEDEQSLISVGLSPSELFAIVSHDNVNNH